MSTRSPRQHRGVTACQFAQVDGIQYSFDWSQPAGERIQNAVIVNDDGSTNDVLVANGRLEGNAEETVKVVTLGFLTDGGDGYRLGEGTSQSRVNLVDAFVDDGQFTFAEKGTEQDAFAEYMASMFSETPFSDAETPASEDLRIQILDERSDAIFGVPIDPLLRLYDAAFDRDADGKGLSYWVEINETVGLNDIANNLIASQEFIDQHGLLDQEGFVDLMYANILEREAEAAGKAYWAGQLEAGVEQGIVMVGIAESEESLSPGVLLSVDVY